MLLANTTVAGHVLEAFPHSALLRRHPNPSPDDFAPLAAALRAHGQSLDLSTPLSFARSLDGCTKRDEP